MDAAKLKEILERHLHWIREDCDGWEKMKANLSRADLFGANLSRANLSRFVKVYYGEYNRANLIHRLQKTEPALIIRAGKASVATGYNKYAREILNVYNKSTTTGRLPDKL